MQTGKCFWFFQVPCGKNGIFLAVLASPPPPLPLRPTHGGRARSSARRWCRRSLRWCHPKGASACGMTNRKALAIAYMCLRKVVSGQDFLLNSFLIDFKSQNQKPASCMCNNRRAFAIAANNCQRISKLFCHILPLYTLIFPQIRVADKLWGFLLLHVQGQGRKLLGQGAEPGCCAGCCQGAIWGLWMAF